MENFKKYGFKISNNKTGIMYVCKSKNHSNGDLVGIIKKINKKRFNFSSFDLRKFKQKILDNMVLIGLY